MIKRYFDILHTTVTLIGYALGSVIFGLALMPSFYLVRSVWKAASTNPDSLLNAFWICLSLGAAFFLSGLTLLVVLVIFRNVFQIKNKETAGEFRALPIPLLRDATYNFLVNLVQNTFLPFVRGTPILIWFYRGMGAKIGKGTLITTYRIMDCDLVEIGKGCVIGGGVAISAHLGEKESGVLKRVVIGDRVTIGTDTIVMPGAVIENNVIVGANSVIPKYAHLEANSMYGGVPVKKIESRGTPDAAEMQGE